MIGESLSKRSIFDQTLTLSFFRFVTAAHGEPMGTVPYTFVSTTAQHARTTYLLRITETHHQRTCEAEEGGKSVLRDCAFSAIFDRAASIIFVDFERNP